MWTNKHSLRDLNGSKSMWQNLWWTGINVENEKELGWSNDDFLHAAWWIVFLPRGNWLCLQKCFKPIFPLKHRVDDVSGHFRLFTYPLVSLISRIKVTIWNKYSNVEGVHLNECWIIFAADTLYNLTALLVSLQRAQGYNLFSFTEYSTKNWV